MGCVWADSGLLEMVIELMAEVLVTAFAKGQSFVFVGEEVLDVASAAVVAAFEYFAAVDQSFALVVAVQVVASVVAVALVHPASVVQPFVEVAALVAASVEVPVAASMAALVAAFVEAHYEFAVA